MTRPAALVAAIALLGAACAAQRPGASATAGGGLAPCPGTPNCVSSLAPDPVHAVEPLPYRGTGEETREELRRLLRGLPRTRIVEERPDWLRAECRSALFRFVDDLEFLFDDERRQVHVRSASRVGRSDLGVNRKRVEEIRRRWLLRP